MKKISEEKLSKMKTADELLKKKYGDLGSESRMEFEAKAKAYYYSALLQEERKRQKVTQAELAVRVGKNRAYIAKLERGETDIQLSTFLALSSALGLKWTLSHAK